MKTKLIAGLCSAALAATCMGFTVSADTTEEFTSYEATTEYVKQIGRTYYCEDALWMGYSASGIEFNCTGTQAKVTVVSDKSYKLVNSRPRIAFYLNGELAYDTQLEEASTVFTFDLDETKTNTIRLVKLSEGAQSTMGVDKIEVNSTDAITPTAAKAHSIEFIGDSITCGYGVDASSGSFSTKTENASKTYAYKTAAALDADYSFVSVSGIGIISGYTNSDDKNDAMIMPPYYDKLTFSWSSFADKVYPTDMEWDFSKYQPELVVINLGQNDSSYTKGDETKCAEFEDGYVDFIKEVRQYNPDAEILCILGTMGQDLYPQIADAVVKYSEETGDTKVNSLKLNQQDTTNDGKGVDWHPSELSHEKAADKLITNIMNLYGWESDYTEKYPDSSESTADSSEVSSELDSNNDSDAASSVADTTTSSKAAATSSKAAATNSTTSTTPNTGVAAVGTTAAVAILGAAVIVLKKRK